MKTYLALLLLLLYCPKIGAGETHLVLLGAGGEEEGSASTIFDNSAKLLARFYNKNASNYQVMVSYNGGHANTEKIIKNDYNKASLKTSFTQEGYQKVINELLVKIKSNPPQIKEGNQIMVFIDSHGAERKENETSHSVAFAYSPMDEMSTGPSKKGGTLNLDSLKDLIAHAKEKNIKLAIIDGSCHSGNTLNLANENTCVISGSAANQFATDFTDFLVQEFRPGKSLEDAFISARAKADGVPFPMISSPAGNSTQDKMKNFLPYLFYHDNNEDLDKIDKYLSENGNAIGICKKEIEFNELSQFLKFIGNFKQFHKKDNAPRELERLKKNLENYKKVQLTYLKDLAKFNVPNEQLDRKINFTSGDYSIEYSPRELLESDFKNLISNAEKDKSLSSNSEDIQTYQHFIKIYSEASVKKDELLKNEIYKNRYQIYEKIKSDANLTEKIARTISVDLKKVYEVYYRDIMTKTKNKPNPCAEFKL